MSTIEAPMPPRPAVPAPADADEACDLVSWRLSAAPEWCGQTGGCTARNGRPALATHHALYRVAAFGWRTTGEYRCSAHVPRRPRSTGGNP
jgi:hypothetical protein